MHTSAHLFVTVLIGLVSMILVGDWRVGYLVWLWGGCLLTGVLIDADHAVMWAIYSKCHLEDGPLLPSLYHALCNTGGPYSYYHPFTIGAVGLFVSCLRPFSYTLPMLGCLLAHYLMDFCPLRPTVSMESFTTSLFSLALGAAFSLTLFWSARSYVLLR